jgi:hypothetical protein
VAATHLNRRGGNFREHLSTQDLKVFRTHWHRGLSASAAANEDFGPAR